jgi:cytochrome c-type biogenesis protein CcmE
MTVSTPVPPSIRRRGWGPWLVGAGVAAIIGWLAFSGVGNALVYYLTPTELAARGEAAIGQSVRLGGLVLPGSVSGSATDLTFVLTDGETEITVHSSVAPTSSFREGAGAVVEGALGPDGVFEADEVLVKHDENYVAPTQGQLPAR